MNGKFAVFDIDGTLYRWQLFHELVVELTRTDAFPSDTFDVVDAAWNDWRRGTMSFHDYEMMVVRTLNENLPNIPVDTFEAACDKIISLSGHKVHSYTLALLKRLKESGYTIIAISGSQQELLDRFASKHGIDIAIGAKYERDGDRFTGKMERMTIGRKEVILGELLQQHSLTMQGSYGVGDSEGDIQMLASVENPIAFNPSEGLFSYAKEAKWPIVIERKNIAYRLENQHDALVLAETIIY